MSSLPISFCTLFLYKKKSSATVLPYHIRAYSKKFRSIWWEVTLEKTYPIKCYKSIIGKWTSFQINAFFWLKKRRREKDIPLITNI